MTQELRNMLAQTEQSLTSAPVVKIDAAAAAHLPRDIALLVIDVQTRFCGTYDGDDGDSTRKSELISTIVPQFRKAGVQVYAIHFTGDYQPGAHDPSEIDFYIFKPDAADILVRKKNCSGFMGTSLNDMLQERGIKSVLACGFYTSACVEATVGDAKKLGYNVTVLEDIVGDGYATRPNDPTIDAMQSKGIEFIHSSKALQRLKV